MMKSEQIKAVAEMAVLAVAAYLLYKVYSGVSGVVSGAYQVVSDAAEKAGDIVLGTEAENLRQILNQALSKKGVNPSDYLLMFPQPTKGQKLPPGSWVVTYQSKNYYFVKKGAMPIYSL